MWGVCNSKNELIADSIRLKRAAAIKAMSAINNVVGYVELQEAGYRARRLTLREIEAWALVKALMGDSKDELQIRGGAVRPVDQSTLLSTNTNNPITNTAEDATLTQVGRSEESAIDTEYAPKKAISQKAGDLIDRIMPIDNFDLMLGVSMGGFIGSCIGLQPWFVCVLFVLQILLAACSVKRVLSRSTEAQLQRDIRSGAVVGSRVTYIGPEVTEESIRQSSHCR